MSKTTVPKDSKSRTRTKRTPKKTTTEAQGMINPFLHVCPVDAPVRINSCHLSIKGYLFKFTLVIFILKGHTNLFNADSVDPNQTPRVAASDLGLHCVSLSQSLVNIILARPSIGIPAV